MNRFVRCLLTIIALAGSVRADDYPRNDRIDIVHYDFELTLSDASDEIRGRAEVFVRFRESAVDEFALDLIGDSGKTGMTVSSVTSSGQAVEFQHAGDRLTIRPLIETHAGDVRSYVIEYRGVPADGLIISQNLHDERTFFGDNFPDRARNWLPTLDHPYDKATCQFDITAPDHYQVIATGIMTEETDLPGGLRRTHWEEAVPLSTYMMVIGVARFAVRHRGETRGIPQETWVYARDRDAGFEAFDQAVRPFEYFSDYIGPYPFRKLAHVQSRTRYGGMENPGNIFYDEQTVIGPRPVEDLITHEVAHQWFGDTVTCADWNHVWLSEGFATYFTHLYNEATHGRASLVAGLIEDRNLIVRSMRRRPGIAIVDPDVPVTGILSPMTYEKAGWVLHMLRREIGDELFHAAIRDYYRRHLYGNVLTEDFQAAVEEIADRDLGRFFRQWIYTPGLPELEGDWSYDANAGNVTVSITQIREDGFLYDVPLDLALRFEEGGPLSIETLHIDAQENVFTFDADHEPVDVILDPDTWLLMQSQFEKK